MKDPEESCRQCSTKPQKLYEGSGRVVFIVQHKAVKVTRRNWRRVTMTVLHGAMKVTWRILRTRARSRESYKKDLERSRDDSAPRSCESYLKGPEKSRAWSHKSYMKDQEKSRADSAARSKANYSKDVKESRTLKRQRYVMLCVCSLNH